MLTQFKKEGIYMKKIKLSNVIIAAVIYLALFLLGATSGLIHPVCFAYGGTVLPLLFSFVYLLASANMRTFGSALALNGFVLIIGLIAGEGNAALIVGMIILTVLAEIIRKIFGYDSIKGVRYSFIPFAFSFYSYSAHWWTDKSGTLAAAVEEMPAGYADKVATVIDNKPLLVVMLILTVPIAIIGIRLAEKLLKNQVKKLK